MINDCIIKTSKTAGILSTFLEKPVKCAEIFQSPICKFPNATLKLKTPIRKIPNAILKLKTRFRKIPNATLKLKTPIRKVPNATLKLRTRIRKIRNEILTILGLFMKRLEVYRAEIKRAIQRIALTL